MTYSMRLVSVSDGKRMACFLLGGVLSILAYVEVLVVVLDVIFGCCVRGLKPQTNDYSGDYYVISVKYAKHGARLNLYNNAQL